MTGSEVGEREGGIEKGPRAWIRTQDCARAMYVGALHKAIDTDQKTCFVGFHLNWL